MKTLQPSTTGIYHPKARITWHAISFVDHNGEAFVIAAPSRSSVLLLAKSHIADTRNLIVEKINITKGPKA
jgi:hypothetical protein